MITLRQLQYLVSLGRHRHFGRAAEECAVTQPALSMQIREMERDIGAALVERRPGDVAFTEMGLEIARRGEAILTAARDLVDFARHQELLAGDLRVGIIPTLAPYVLPRLLPLLQRRYPKLRLDVRETQTAHLVRELRAGELDVVLLALPIDAPDVETSVLFDDPFVLAVPATDPRPARSRIKVDDVDPKRLILLEEGHCLRDQALEFCLAARRPASAALGATSLATVMQMVANGYGVTLLPRVAIETEGRDARLKLLRFSGPEPSRSIGLAWRPTSPRKADFAMLGDMVRVSLGHSSGKRKAVGAQ